MHVRAALATLAAAALCGLATEARADLVTAQSVVALTGGSAILDDNLFPFDRSDRASVLDGDYAIDVTSASGNNTEEWFVIQYAPGDPAGNLDFVIALGSDTSFVSLVHLDFYKSGDYSPDLDLGERASVDLFEIMFADTVDHLHFTANDLTLNGGMELASLNAYDSVRAVFRFEFANSSQLQIDLVANPEPATMALFALGAAGLGGLAWRRRRARAAAK